jgi:hypothetical protein
VSAVEKTSSPRAWFVEGPTLGFGCLAWPKRILLAHARKLGPVSIFSEMRPENFFRNTNISLRFFAETKNENISLERSILCNRNSKATKEKHCAVL